MYPITQRKILHFVTIKVSAILKTRIAIFFQPHINYTLRIPMNMPEEYPNFFRLAHATLGHLHVTIPKTVAQLRELLGADKPLPVLLDFLRQKNLVLRTTNGYTITPSGAKERETPVVLATFADAT